MATQQGMISLSGKVGDLIFAKRKGKSYAKAKSKKPMNQTEATKKSSIDFGEASKVGARMRRGFAPLLKEYGNNDLVSRFTKQILKIFKTIPASFVGSKKLGHGHVGIFRDFQFNAYTPLYALLFEQPRVNVEAAGLNITFKKSSIENLFKKIAKTDRVVLQLMVCNFNLEGDDDEVICIKDLVIPLDSEYFRGAKLQVPLKFVGEQMVQVALGIHFLGDNSMCNDRTKKAAGISYVARLSDGLEVKFVPDQPVTTHLEEDQGTLAWEME